MARNTATTTLALRLIAGLLMPLAAMAEPVVIYPPGATMRLTDAPIRVESQRLQVALTEKLVLSAGQGAQFMVTVVAPDDYVLQVMAAPAQLIDLAADTVAALPPGRYRVTTASPQLRQLDASTGVPRPDSPHAPSGTSYDQGYLLGDYVMVRQDAYLTVDQKIVNNFVSNLLHCLSGRCR